MPIYSHGYAVKKLDQDLKQAEWQLFCHDLSLLLNHKSSILACSSYFFCAPSFAYCSWPWVTNDGPLFIGYLLLGWSDGLLVQPCPDSDCDGEALITSFGGSPFSGSNRWSGYCKGCLSDQNGSRTDVRFMELVEFVSKLRQRFPDSVTEWEEYDGFQFSWAGNGREPAKRKRRIVRALADPVSIETLIQELNSGYIRPGDALGNVSLLRAEHKLKLSNKSGAELNIDVR